MGFFSEIQNFQACDPKFLFLYYAVFSRRRDRSNVGSAVWANERKAEPEGYSVELFTPEVARATKTKVKNISVKRFSSGVNGHRHKCLPNVCIQKVDANMS